MAAVDGESSAAARASELLSEASAQALEWGRFKSVLAALAATDLGRERLLALEPTADRAELAERRAAVSEAALLLEAGALVPALGERVGDLAERLLTDRPPLAGAEIVDLGGLLAASGAARARLLGAAEEAPTLAGWASPLADPRPWVEAITRTLDRRGVVRDDASPLLVALRRRIQGARSKLYDDLAALRDSQRDAFAEETIPLRGGRLVLLLDAGARGRVPGLTHGRSASGRSFYFEPLAAVEANNTLQQSIEEDEAERARLFVELLERLRAAQREIARHSRFLAALDALESTHRYARLAEARLPALAEDGELVLTAARHPLLDPRLAELRERALGQAGHRGQAVPLDLELSPRRRLLVVTGPNAGGKTVALKTAGLLAVAAQAGLPLPAAEGSALPVFRTIVAAVGDEQDLMADRSTFSGRLLRLGEVWRARSPQSLLLVDELGSGTDPEEGAALALGLVEGLLAAGALAVVTTHLARLAAAALELSGAGCAAMEFDPASGRPTYRLTPGPPGGSEALALARRLGLPAAWLERAERWLAPEHRDLQRLLAELEAARAELLAARAATEAERAELSLARARHERAEGELSVERLELSARLRGELSTFRRETLARLAAEVERLRAEFGAGRRRDLAERATERLFAAAPPLGEEAEEPAAEGELVVGATVRHLGLGWSGRIERIDGGLAEVVVGGKRLKAAAGELALAPPGTAEGGRSRVPRPGPRADRGARDDRPEETAAELNLIGERVEPALAALEAFLDRAARAGLAQVRIVHGHGSGRLRQALREQLRRHPLAAAFRAGDEREGGNGATVVTLR